MAARFGTFMFMERVSGSYDNILSVRVIYPELILRMIVCHGPQEDDETEIRQSVFDNLSVEVERSRAADEIPIVMGDMNAKVLVEKGEIVADTPNGSICDGSGQRNTP